MFKSISTQTGNYSYAVNLEFTGYEPFEFGFSGESKLFSFTGESGKIYDQDSNFAYSYEKNETVQVSGNRFDLYNNYFINNSFFNSNNSQNTGYTEYFYFDGPVVPQLSFNGKHPNYRVASGEFLNGNQSGRLYVYNDGVENFKFYSGNFTGPSGSVFSFSYPFDSGNITSLKTFDINSVLAQGGSGKYSVNAEFYTNFGLVNKNFDIYSIFELEVFLSLFGSPAFTETGDYDYTLSYDLTYGSDKSTDPYDIYFEFSNLSGRGDFGLFTGGTGYYTGTSNVDISTNKTITNSGQLTGLIDFTITGINPYLGYPYTGTANAIYYSPFQYATGDFEYIYSILSTGLATGFITNNVEVPSGDFPNQPIGFTGELDYGFHTITGTGLLNLTGTSYYQGNSWIVDNFQYTGIITGEVFSSGTTGIVIETGITGFSTEYFSTGVSGISYSYRYISSSNDLTGYFNETINITGNGDFTQNSYDLTGLFYHRVRSADGTAQNLQKFDFNVTEMQSVNSTGKVFFTGNYIGSGTGAFLGYIEKEGYTGSAIGGSFESFSKIINLGDSSVGWASKSLGSLDMFPIKAFESDAPLEISGNSGIALIPVSTDDLAEVYSFSTNDGSRGNYTRYPSWIRYKWMDGTATIGDEVNFRISPFYYASGTGIYRENRNIGAGLFLYSGAYPDLKYFDGISDNFDFFDSNDSWSESINISRSYSLFDNNKEQWEILFATDEDVPNSGFFFLAWEDQSNSTQDNSPKVFNSFLGDTPSIGDVTGYIFSEESKAPTGVLTEGFVYNDDVKFKEGVSTFNTGIPITGSGAVSNYKASFGESDSYKITGEFTGLLLNNYFEAGGGLGSSLTGTKYYSSSTGVNVFRILTGSFANDDIYLNYAKTTDNDLNTVSIENILGEDNISAAGNLAQYTIGPSHPNLEAISGDIEKQLTGLSFNVFLEDPYLVISGFNTQHIKFGFGSSNSSFFAGSVYKYTTDSINNAVTGISGVSNGTGYQSLSNFSSFTTGLLSGTGFISGQWIERDDISGKWDITRSGDYGIVPTTFTGSFQGTGLITGLESFTINDGSGSSLLSGQKTGEVFGFAYGPIFSSGINITPFSGFLNVLYEGTGYYEKTFSVDVQGSGFSLDIPTYVKTFSGEYEFYTGTTTGNLIQLDYDSNNFLWSGVNTVTGLGEFALQIKKTKEIGSDSLELFYSGQSNVTGGFII